MQQPTVDVEAILNGLAANNPQKLNWQISIVDLMKVLGLDSSMQKPPGACEEAGLQRGYRRLGRDGHVAAYASYEETGESGGKVPASLRG